MKRGISLLVLSTLFTFIFSAVSALAQPYGYSTTGFAGLPSISELVNNEWFNAAILFLIVFAFCWFVLQQVFKARKGIAMALSMLIALVGALGVIYAYGPIIGRLGNLLTIVIFIAICALLWFQFRKSKLPVFLILAGLSLFWLLWARNQLCPPVGIIPHEACIILDTIAVVVLIIALIKLIAWLIKKLPAFGGGGGGVNGEPVPGRVNYVLTVGAQGNGTTNPRPGNYQKRERSRVRVSARANPNARLDHWELDGTSIGTARTVTVFMDNNHTLMAVFTGETREPEQAPKIRFVARPSRIRPGERARLLWATMRANYVGIAAGAQLIAKKGPKGILDVMPKHTTNYYATAVGPGGSTQAVATVVVEGEHEPQLALTHDPKITLTASHARVGRGVPVTLKWHAESSNYVILALERGRQKRVGVSGSQVVHPLESEIYTAVAFGKNGKRAVSRIKVEVMLALTGPQGKPIPMEEKKEEIVRRERTKAELQQKWNYYRNLYEQEWNNYQARAQKEKFRGGIPPGNTPEGHKRHNYYKAMKAVENMAKKQKIKLSLTKPR